MFKKTLTRYLFAGVVLLSIIALIAFFNAWTFAPHVSPHVAPQPVENKAEYKAKNGQKTYVAYAVSNGWHVGVVVPAGRMNALLPELKKRFETSKTGAGMTQSPGFYEIGWGDRGFYEAKEITTVMAVQAMFNSPGSVMHVVAVHNPERAFGKNQVVKFCLSEAQLANLEKYIVSSFATHATGGIISRRLGLYGDSQFFEAAGTYHFLNSCNTWAAKALRSAGFDIKPTFKLFASQVMNNIDVMDIASCQAAI
jgi:uncharacterized protein (TIGR02117 family)